MLWLVPVRVDAQSGGDSRPARGKVDGVEREARHSGHDHDDDDDCNDCDGGFGEAIFVGLFHALFGGGKGAMGAADDAILPGQGYLAYPYAEPGNRETFVLDRVATGLSFTTFSGTYFNDRAVGGTLEAGQLTLEGASDQLLGSLEYTMYREPTQTDTDYLHLIRAGVGGVPRLGRLGFARILVAGRGVILDNGRAAFGPELELGVQAFPVRPWGVSANARGALVKWNGGDWAGFTDLTANGSVFFGRVELMAGWRYTKIGSAEAFNGPTASLRLWF